MVQLDPVLARTYKALMSIVEEKHRIDQDSSLTPAQRQAALQALNLDGCPVVDLGLDFTLPGSSTIELRKGGKDTPVTIHNLEQYLKVNMQSHCYSAPVSRWNGKEKKGMNYSNYLNDLYFSVIVALDSRGGSVATNGILTRRI